MLLKGPNQSKDPEDLFFQVLKDAEGAQTDVFLAEFQLQAASASGGRWEAPLGVLLEMRPGVNCTGQEPDALKSSWRNFPWVKEATTPRTGNCAT